MNKLKLIILTALLPFLFVQCEKKADGDSDPSNDSSFVGMQAKIDGTLWQASEEVMANMTQGRTNISGVGADKSLLMLVLQGLEAGDYMLEQNDLDALFYYPENKLNTYRTDMHEQAGGKASITKVDHENKMISGTFEGALYHIHEQKFVLVTEGKFNLPLTEGSTPTSSSLTVKIDGEEWEAHSVTGGAAMGLIAISATNEDVSRIVALALPEDVTVGEYTFEALGSGDVKGNYSPTASTTYSAGSGTLKVTKHDTAAKHIEGTFQFKAEDFLSSGEAELTEGKFSVTYH